MVVKGLRVLVVEDEPLIASLVNEMLIDLGCVPGGPAATLEDAKALTANETFDAVLLDVRLKGQEVFPLAQALVDRKVHIVFMSGLDAHGLPKHWHGSSSQGSCHWLLPPFGCRGAVRGGVRP